MDAKIKSGIHILASKSISAKSFFMLSFLLSMLTACASSSFTDSSANHVDAVYRDTTHFVSHIGDNSLAAYPNTSGIVQGAAAGSLIGAGTIGFTSGTTGGALMGGAGGAIIGGIIGAFIANNATYIQQLENRGAKVLVLGDHVMIVIPSVQVFRPMTPTMYPQAGDTFDLIAKMVSSYTTMSIKVAAYTDGEGLDTVLKALSQQQAETVVKYLWPRVNTRLLYGVGYGNENHLTKPGGAANARIEITLEKLPV
jgi:flagellar motor protein MotB